MEFTVQQVAHLLKGEVQGEANGKIYKVGKIQEGEAGDITFLSNLKYEPYLYTTQATAVIVNRNFVPKKEVSTALILVDDAYTAFSTLLDEYYKMLNFQKVGIEHPSFQSQTAVLGKDLYIGAFSYIGNQTEIGDNVKIYPNVYIGDKVSIGSNTILYSGVKIYSNSQIGKYCTVHAGAVIGSAGFGFAPQADGTFKAVPQLGNVIIEDHVDIGANTVIDCATMGSTVIEQGVKLDNLIQVAHNVRIGKNTVIAAQTGISGSTQIGENCMIAGQVGIAGHLTIANRTSIAAQSGVMKDLENEGVSIQGSPAWEIKSSFKSFAIYKKLPELKRKVEELERKLKELEKDHSNK